MAKEWRKLCNEELHDLYFLSNTGMIKSRKVSWVGHLTYTREEISPYKVFVRKPEVNKPLLRFGRHMRIILRCPWRKWIGRTYTGLVWLRRCLVEYTCDPFVFRSGLCYFISFRYNVLYCTVLYFILSPSPLFAVSRDRLVLESLYLEDGSVTISTIFLTFWLSYWGMNILLCSIRLFHSKFISKTF